MDILFKLPQSPNNNNNKQQKAEDHMGSLPNSMKPLKKKKQCFSNHTIKQKGKEYDKIIPWSGHYSVYIQVKDTQREKIKPGILDGHRCKTAQQNFYKPNSRTS